MDERTVPVASGFVCEGADELREALMIVELDVRVVSLCEVAGEALTERNDGEVVDVDLIEDMLNDFEGNVAAKSLLRKEKRFSTVTSEYSSL